MALKYSIEYNDVKDVTHRLEIYDDAYVGAEIEVEGTVFLDNSSTDDPLEAIRGQGLRVELEADSILTFSDLYSEEQKTFPVIYERNSVTLFQGWLNPEGWFESFSQDKWKVSFDCIDGLSFLKDLAFVEDSTGLYFTGIKTQLELISLALIRTGLEQNINVDIQVFYTGLSETGCVLDSINARVTRYIKDDKYTIMSCEEVLRDILEPYGACITSRGGEWFIYKPNQLFSSATITYHRFDYEGTALTPTTNTLNTAFALGSEINAFYPHHCSGNQRIYNVNSVGAFRINYKYGDAKSLIANSFFEGTDPLDDWTTESTTNLTFDNPGVTFLGPTGTVTRIENLSSEIIGLSEDDVLKLRWKLNCTLPIGSGFEMDWVYRIVSTTSGGTNLRYLHSNSKTWGTDATVHEINPTFTGGEVVFESTLDALPQDGKVTVELWSASSYGGAPVAFDLELMEFAIEAADERDDPLEGEFHTLQRTTKPSKEVKDIKEVFTGDTASDNYVGTLYKADGNTPTETWFRSGITEAKPILQVMGEETLRLNASVSRVFVGDVFGFFDYLSRVTIDGLTGIFMPIKYSYDTKANVITAEFRQIYGSELIDIDYQLTYDYGETVNPTITG